MIEGCIDFDGDIVFFVKQVFNFLYFIGNFLKKNQYDLAFETKKS